MFRMSFRRCQSVLVTKFEPLELYRYKNTGVYEILISSSKSTLNLLDKAFFTSLLRVTDYLSTDLNDSAQVAILTSKEGTPFSAGLDLSILKSQGPSKSSSTGSVMPAMQNQFLHKKIRFFQDAVSSLARCRIPIICAIDGHCIGGATSIITACDFRYATEEASFTVKEVQVGMAADIGVLQRLPYIVGEGRARELAYTARVFKGVEAKQIGLVEEVFPSREVMMDAVRKTAESIACNSPLGVQGTKLIMNRRNEPSTQDLLEYTAAWNASNLLCDDVVEASVAFSERRRPKFKNYVVHSGSTHTSLE